MVNETGAGFFSLRDTGSSNSRTTSSRNPNHSIDYVLDEHKEERPNIVTLSPEVEVIKLEESNDNEENFTSFFEDDTVIYETPVELNLSETEKKKEAIKERIEKAKKFYFDNYNYQINLNHDSYVRFHSIENFKVGFKYQNRIDGMAEVELMCQLVNERQKIKWTCRKLYFLESSLRVDTSVNSKLLAKYIGSTLIAFKTEIEEEINEYRWMLKVYRDRFIYVRDKIVDRLSMELTTIKLIKDYDQVYQFFCNEIDNKC